MTVSRGEPGGIEPLLTPRQVAETLAVSEQTVRRWRFDGDGPAPVRLGYRTVRYRRSDVERFVTERAGGQG